jgi:choline kinase
MKAVILAAGRGSRLRAVTGALPKCLARVGSLTLLERQILALRAHDVRDIIVVAGCGISAVRPVCHGRASVLHNARYASTNSLYSLWLAREALTEGFVVLNGDVLFHPQLLSDLLTARHDDALLMEARGDAVFSDEEMKVQVRAGRVVDIAKTIASAEADGENVGIAKFGAVGASVLIDEMDRLVVDGGSRAWLPAAFAAFVNRRPLHVVETRGFPWLDVDFPEDYWRACAELLPALEPDRSVHCALTPATVSGRKLHHV